MKKERDCRFELIRAVAILFVVAVHCLKVYPDDGTPWRFFTFHLLDDLFHTCLGLFFMLSGYFALRKPVAEGKYREYYLNKLVTLVLPVVLYMFIYSAGILFKDTRSLAGLPLRLVKDVAYGHFGVTHFWFMYVLVGLVFVAPILARAIDGLQKKTLTLFVCLGLGYNAFSALVPYFLGAPHTWHFPLGGWAAFFLLGGCINKIITTQKEKKWAIAAGLVGLVVMMLKHYFWSYELFMHELMASYIVYVVMMWVLLLKIDVKSGTAKKVVLFMGKRSFGVYLMHYGVIPCVLLFMNRVSDQMPVFIFYLLFLAVVLVVSLASSYAFEVVVIKPLQKLLGKVLLGSSASKV